VGEGVFLPVGGDDGPGGVSVRRTWRISYLAPPSDDELEEEGLEGTGLAPSSPERLRTLVTEGFLL